MFGISLGVGYRESNKLHFNAHLKEQLSLPNSSSHMCLPFPLPTVVNIKPEVKPEFAWCSLASLPRFLSFELQFWGNKTKKGWRIVPWTLPDGARRQLRRTCQKKRVCACLCVHKPFTKLINLPKSLHLKKLQIKPTVTCQPWEEVYHHLYSYISSIQVVWRCFLQSPAVFSCLWITEGWSWSWQLYPHLMRAQVNALEPTHQLQTFTNFFFSKKIFTNYLLKITFTNFFFTLLIIPCSLQLLTQPQDIISILKLFWNGRGRNKKSDNLTEININLNLHNSSA